MINVNEFAEKVFGILKGFHCQLKLYDGMGNEIISPSNTRRFFSFDPNLMVTLDEIEQSLIVSLGNTTTLKDTEKLQYTLRTIANQYLYNYQIRTFGKSVQPKDFAHEVKSKKFAMSESFSRMTGTKHKSMQICKEVKIHIEHSKPVTGEKLGERSRNIKKIFIETKDESFCMPTTNIQASRAMANHIRYGGNFQDSVSKYICEQSTILQKLNEFIKYTKENHLVNESTQDTILVVKESINSIKSTFHSLMKPRSYSIVKERILTHDLTEEYESDVTDIRDMFTVKLFNEELNDVLPYINKRRSDRQKFFEHITDLSLLPVALSSELTNNLLEFTNKKSKLQYFISNLQESVKDSVLRAYLETLDSKIENNLINKYDVGIIENILDNCFVDVGFKEGSNLVEESELSILNFLK